MFPVECNSITGFDKSTSQKHYCLFCLPDKEWAIARQLMQLVPKTQAFPLQRLKRKTVRGVTTSVTEILFPRYVFIETSADIFSYPYQQINGVITMLHNNVGHELVGTDNDFVAWLFSLGGVLGFSRACLENGRVRILSGPIKTLEEHIIKLDKRNRNALVALNFGRQASRVWLGYELVNEGIAP